ncbi:segregation/condensation protein A [Lactococcus garvieae]|jgi:segregation and condensation protein A|uniref:segregation/condensation protein A n=1 Tax=Lactococcus garvieae TaxID=1363 RepID=UPI0009BD32E0|nr:segregation/condensation protein A [Lactococcus garvieae]
MTEEIQIKINDFEGPLDLLLHLVGQYKVDIFEVPLVPIIEQYLNFLKTMKTLELEIAGEYMVMASQLMLIKSRRLLPTVAEEFIEDTEQLEQDLLAQIDEYRKYKALSQDIAQMHEKRSHFYSKAKTEIIGEDAVLLQDHSSLDLFLAFSNVLELHKQTVTDENTTIEAEKYSISDKIVELSSFFARRKSCKFSSLFSKKTSKEELLTTFMALLELVKTQQVTFTQDHVFGEILLERGKGKDE